MKHLLHEISQYSGYMAGLMKYACMENILKQRLLRGISLIGVSKCRLQYMFHFREKQGRKSSCKFSTDMQKMYKNRIYEP
jgi:PHP family Zn ribbon phosphoesterase